MDLFGNKWAELSTNRKHRFVLYRCWDSSKPAAMVIGLNPSTADESEDDPTIGFVSRVLNYNGYGSLYMVNLFTMITPHPEELVRDKTSIQALRIWNKYSKKVKDVVFAWGGFDTMDRDKLAFETFPNALCFDQLIDGAPRHGMYLKTETQLKKFMRSKVLQGILAETPKSVTDKVKAYGKKKIEESVIRTLGLYQPFATLMLHGKVETRWVNGKKKPPFPLGDYLIYACQKCYQFEEAEDLMGDQLHEAHMAFKKEMQIEKGTLDIKTKEFLLGHAICIGTLVRIIDPITPETNKNTFVEYTAPCTRRRVGLVFENVKRIVPFDFKGKQGIGFLSPEDAAKIKFV